MRSSLYLPSIILVSVLCFLPSHDASEAEPFPSTIPPESKSHIISVTESGLNPSTLHISENDKFIFFLNDSSDSLVTIAVNYSKHATHCASGNLKIQDNGTIRSTEQIAPKDFAGACFHDPGSYAFTVQGLRSRPEGLKGTIIIK